ncbi:MAG: hypothetical protein M1326_03745, partial [Cyanobacteria bacterium]|nr:hypothetical protein [Cyanobacteriota bacterium]
TFNNLWYEISILFKRKFYKLNHFKTNEILNIDIEKLYQLLQIINYVFCGFSINHFNLDEDNLIINIRFNNSLNYEYFNLGVNTDNIYNLKNHLSLQGFLGMNLMNTLNTKFILSADELHLTIPV